MSIRCSRGLFVGVEEYVGLDDVHQLPKASGDASKLFTYFSMAQTDGVWNLLIDNELNTTRPSRLNLLRELTSLAAGLSPNQCGMFYFAGHGVTFDGQLILAPCDFRKEQPFDSGVPLSRVFEIFREEFANSQAHFLFILDCCREGPVIGPGNDIPPNVSVIYACPAGQAAVQDQDGGLLARALLKVLRRLGENKVTSSRVPTKSLQQVFRELKKQLRLDGMGNISEPELRGSGSVDIGIPLVQVMTRIPAKQGPSCFLETYELDSRNELLQASLNDSLAAFFGLDPHTCPNLTAFNDGKGCIEVTLPRDTETVDTRACLEFLLTQYDVFVRLSLRWSDQVHFSHFRQFAEQQNLISSTIERDEQYMYGWTNAEREGRMFVDYRSNGTHVSVECQSRETELLSLAFLLPRLGDLYERLWAIA